MPEISLKAKIKRLQELLLKAKEPVRKIELLLDLAKLIRRSDTDQSMKYAAEGLELARTQGYNTGIAQASLELAEIYNNLKGDNDKALVFAQEALKNYQKIEDGNGISQALGILGLIYTNLSDFLKAEDYLNQSMEFAIREKDSHSIAAIYNWLGIMYYHSGKYDRAIADYTKGLEVSQQYSYSETEARILGNLAHTYTSLGEYATAYKLRIQSLEIRKKINDPTGIVFSHIGIAKSHSNFKDFEKALYHLRSALNISRALKNSLLTVDILLKIAEIHSASGQYGSALNELHYAKEMIADLNHPRFKSQVAIGYGICHIALGNAEEGIQWLSDAYTISENTKSTSGLSIACQELAVAYRLKNDNQQSLQFAEQGLQLALSIGNVSIIAGNYLELAKTYYVIQDFPQVINNAEKVVENATRLGNKLYLAQAFKIIAESHTKTGDFQQSAEYYKKYLETREEMLNEHTNHKVQTLLVEFDVERMRHEAEINKLKSEQYERELALKNKELTTLALHLVNKNEFLKTIGDQISEDVSNTSQFIKNISKLVQNDANSEDEWKLFEKQFIQVNPDFTTRLTEVSDSPLTSTELKICSLLRTGLNSQEISNMLFLSKRTVENHRYNIHRKLNLGNHKLIPYLMSV